MVIRAPRDLAVIVAERQYGHALTFTLATHSPCATGPWVINCVRRTISLSFLSLPPYFCLLACTMWTGQWGAECKARASSFPSERQRAARGKVREPTGPQQREGRRLAGSGPAGQNRNARGRNMFCVTLKDRPARRRKGGARTEVVLTPPKSRVTPLPNRPSTARTPLQNSWLR